MCRETRCDRVQAGQHLAQRADKVGGRDPNDDSEEATAARLLAEADRSMYATKRGRCRHLVLVSPDFALSTSMSAGQVI